MCIENGLEGHTSNETYVLSWEWGTEQSRGKLVNFMDISWSGLNVELPGSNGGGGGLEYVTSKLWHD